MIREDDTQPVPHFIEEPAEPFAYGDRTLWALRDQSFRPDDESYGTRVRPTARFTPVHDVVVVHQALPPTDPIARLEQKLDAAMRMMETIQRRLDSMDETVAMVINRH